MTRPNMPPIERIYMNSRREGDCRIWTGALRTDTGTPRIRVGDTSRDPRAVIWELARDGKITIPKGVPMQNTCGNAPLCVDINHVAIRDEDIPNTEWDFRKVVCLRCVLVRQVLSVVADDTRCRQCGDLMTPERTRRVM